jgi:hypothetical protein
MKLGGSIMKWQSYRLPGPGCIARKLETGNGNSFSLLAFFKYLCKLILKINRKE